jgi:hypothetical protein
MEQENSGQIWPLGYGEKSQRERLTSVGKLLSKAFNFSLKLFPKSVAVTVITGLCISVSIVLGIGLTFLLNCTIGVTLSVIIASLTFGLFTIYCWMWDYTSVLALVCNVEQEAKIKQSLKTGWKLAMPCLIVVGWFGLIVSGGVICLLIPGIIFGIWFLFAPYILICENLKGRDVLVRSKNLTKGYRWNIFGRIFVLLLIVIGPSLLLSFLEAKILGYSIILRIGYIVLNIFLNMFWQVLATVYLFLIYKDLLEIKGPLTEELKGFPKNCAGILFSILGVVAFAVCIVAIVYTIYN